MQMPRDMRQRLYAKTRRATSRPEEQGEVFLLPCLLWEGAVDNTGYGVFKAFKGCMGLPSGIVRVHRLAYWYHIGPFPRHVQVDHKCRNRTCMEPGHLRLLGIIEHARKSNVDKAMDQAIDSVVDNWEDVL